MIDEALLRPGRLEVHLEINLPDEPGRHQILKIHTEKMRVNRIMDKDVDLDELAALTKNFSGAEIAGLIKDASSHALNRHVKLNTGTRFQGDASDMKVNRDDFLMALDEVHPAFGVSEEDLAACIQGSIIKYSRGINVPPSPSPHPLMPGNSENGKTVRRTSPHKYSNAARQYPSPRAQWKWENSTGSLRCAQL
jgi:vesicle-fusing ATPase